MLGLGYLTTTFVDRGETDEYDFLWPDFVADGAWHILDLGDIVPEGANTVLLERKIKNVNIGKVFFLRSVTAGGERNVAGLITQVGNLRISDSASVPLDQYRNIQYKLTAVPWADIFITVRGWWL